MGIVHHATYISYFEVGRVDYMRRRGLNYTSWTEMGFHLPVVEVHVRYRRTVRFDELVVLETRLVALARVRVRFDYRLLRELPNREEELLAEGYTLLACVDHDHVPRRLPAGAEAVLRGPELGDDGVPELPRIAVVR